MWITKIIFEEEKKEDVETIFFWVGRRNFQEKSTNSYNFKQFIF